MTVQITKHRTRQVSSERYCSYLHCFLCFFSLKDKITVKQQQWQKESFAMTFRLENLPMLQSNIAERKKKVARRGKFPFLRRISDDLYEGHVYYVVLSANNNYFFKLSRFSSGLSFCHSSLTFPLRFYVRSSLCSFVSIFLFRSFCFSFFLSWRSHLPFGTYTLFFRSTKTNKSCRIFFLPIC